MNKISCPVVTNMKDLMDFVMERVRTFTILDYAVFEFTLLSIGAIIGSFFSDFVKKRLPFFTIVFVLGYIYIMVKIFLPKAKNKRH